MRFRPRREKRDSSKLCSLTEFWRKSRPALASFPTFTILADAKPPEARPSEAKTSFLLSAFNSARTFCQALSDTWPHAVAIAV